MAVKRSDRSKRKAKDITLRDVVVHMEHMEQRLSSKIEENTRRIDENTRGIVGNTGAIQKLEHCVDRLEENLTARIDALEEDLTATMKDTYNIRRHVGMVAADDE